MFIPFGSLLPTVLLSSSRVQKQSGVFNEELRVHVVRAVIGVGVDDQLRIRHVLLHDEREHRGYVHVVTAIHDECWLLDRLQIVGGPLLLDAPLANRFDLGGRHLVVHFRIAALLPTTRALQELPSRRLARRGRTEFDREPDILGRIVGGTKEPPCSLGYQLHSLTAARTCAIDDQPANEVGRLQGVSLPTSPPIEKPNRSTCFRPSALMKAMASAPIRSNVVGTSPELLETPALLNKITSRSRAKPSVTVGSQ